MPNSQQESVPVDKNGQVIDRKHAAWPDCMGVLTSWTILMATPF